MKMSPAGHNRRPELLSREPFLQAPPPQFWCCFLPSSFQLVTSLLSCSSCTLLLPWFQQTWPMHV